MIHRHLHHRHRHQNTLLIRDHTVRHFSYSFSLSLILNAHIQFTMHTMGGVNKNPHARLAAFVPAWSARSTSKFFSNIFFSSACAFWLWHVSNQAWSYLNLKPFSKFFLIVFFSIPNIQYSILCVIPLLFLDDFKWIFEFQYVTWQYFVFSKNGLCWSCMRVTFTLDSTASKIRYSNCLPL